ncbi:MAG: aminomethyl-transferring glycine dehydrogenase subunit GcvPB, partial [Deltaproteobacteria bacterium]|nr:aminomethyl-transferring glycine dehydrogenase subunit GcvPB [Deltaproteobacteria bacterium]
MKKGQAERGLVFDEPLLWEKGKKGRTGFSIPKSDVEPSPLDEELVSPGPD